MERIKTINGNTIYAIPKEKLNKELIAKGDWPINYYVPGRILNPYYITINKIKYRFNEYAKIEKFCKAHPKKELIKLTSCEITELKFKNN
jgi:hypothetical protein